MKKKYNSLQVGSSNNGEIYVDILNWEFIEVDCGPIYFSKIYDYMGNLMTRDLKIQILFHTNDGEYCGGSAWGNNGEMVDIINKEIRLNLKYQCNVSEK
jgi:hypothetical protein